LQRWAGKRRRDCPGSAAVAGEAEHWEGKAPQREVERVFAGTVVWLRQDSVDLPCPAKTRVSRLEKRGGPARMGETARVRTADLASTAILALCRPPFRQLTMNKRPGQCSCSVLCTVGGCQTRKS